ncbi:MAG: hypothetical protein FWD01_04640, partial [Defluviitaleaceae bacterium]|nr:hypothetical protein [Defluviitaleaceae bacterium]
METKSNKGMLIIIIVLLLVLVGAIVAGALFIVTSMNNSTVEGTGQPTIIQSTPSGIGDIRFYTLSDPIITNLLANPGGSNHVAMVTLGIG